MGEDLTNGQPDPSEPPPKKKRGPPKGSPRKGGRQKGTKNRRTLILEENERKIREAAIAALQLDVSTEIVERRAMPDNRRAKAVLASFMELFAGMAATHQPLPPGVQMGMPGTENRFPDQAKFDKYAALAVEAAKALAPYQDPRYSAVVVGAAVVTKVKVEGGMPDDFEPPERGQLTFEPGTVIDAEDEDDKVVDLIPNKAVG